MNSEFLGTSINLLKSGGISLTEDPDRFGVDGALRAVFSLSMAPL